jgi:2-keto-4-pentenoate hydratase
MIGAEAACDLLFGHWQAGTVLDHLPDDLRPNDRSSAYRVQAAIERHSGFPVYGWKIAATSLAGQRHINVAGPMAGRLLAERRVEAGGRTPLGANRMRVAEPEFCFRMGRSLLPQDRLLSLDEVMDAVASLHPAIEIPDSRYARFFDVGEAQLIADNACAHRFVIGPAAEVEWRAIDLVTHAVTCGLRGEPAFTGNGSTVLGDPRIALTWLANELSGLGLTLGAGQVVMTGTCMTPIALRPNMVVDADFGVLGAVSVTID